MPLVLVGPHGPLGAEETARLAASGVRGVEVRFDPIALDRARPHLVLAFDPGPQTTLDQLCRGAAATVRGEPATRLQAVFCDGADRPVAAVGGAAPRGEPEAVRRLVWQATSLLFPDDYPETYGVNILGGRVSVGGSVGF